MITENKYQLAFEAIEGICRVHKLHFEIRFMSPKVRSIKSVEGWRVCVMGEIFRGSDPVKVISNAISWLVKAKPLPKIKKQYDTERN